MRRVLDGRNMQRILAEQDLKVNLGCGIDIQPGYVNIDKRRIKGVDLAVDMEWCFDHLRGLCREVYISHVL